MTLYSFSRILVSLCLAVSVFRASAQDTPRSGYILDSQTGQPIGRANLRDESGNVVTQSLPDGRFQLDGRQPPATVEVTAVGYKPQRVTLSGKTGTIHIQLEADRVRLDEVRVGLNNRSNRETPGAVAILTADDIQRGSGVSMQAALNSVPGVRMDQSTLSDSRISIRGGGIRSPWGSRAVKLYVNDIPVTETDGTTRVEALDVSNIGHMEIIKGPTSSLYGAGTAGAINIQLQRAPYGERSVELSGLTGAYGLNRTATTYRSGGDVLNSYVAYGWQEYGGYRAHSNDMRRFLTGNFQFFPSEKRTVTVLLSHSAQRSQIPGALTEDQLTADRRQANATNMDKAAGRNQNWTRVGIGQQYRFNEHLSNSTSVFSYFYDLDHPLAYAYIRNHYQSYGGRTRFTYDPRFSRLATVFTVGAEFNQGLTKGSQYENQHGTEGSIRSNIDNRNTFYTLFYQSETQLAPRTLLTAGIGLNSLQYDVDDYLAPHQSGIKRFRMQASPRIGISHGFHDALMLHASIGTGFSPPTASEIRLADGSINPDLQAEEAVNYELGAKGSLFRSRLSYDLAVFRMDMRGELIAHSVQQGITVYTNAGKTEHLGAEAAFSWLAIASTDHPWIERLRPFASLSYSDFTFVNGDYGGNRLTGIAPWVANAGIDLTTKAGFYAYGTYAFNDRLPLNDENTDFHAAYHVLNFKAGYTHVFGKRIKAEVFGGIDNLLDQRYSSFVALNAAAYGGGQPPYYNPSPGRNAYGGLNLSYLF